jgi:hypothetical protein
VVKNHVEIPVFKIVYTQKIPLKHLLTIKIALYLTTTFEKIYMSPYYLTTKIYAEHTKRLNECSRKSLKIKMERKENPANLINQVNHG